jgi:hypothetical protein
MSAIVLYKPKQRYCFSVKLSISKQNELLITYAYYDDDCFCALMYDFLTVCKDNDRTLEEYRLVIQPYACGYERADELVRFYPVDGNEYVLYDGCLNEDVPISDVKTFVCDAIFCWLKVNHTNDDRVLLRLRLRTRDKSKSANNK